MENVTMKSPEMLSIRQVAQRGVLTERALRRLVAENKIQVIRIGKKALINYTRLCEMLQNGEGKIWD